MNIRTAEQFNDYLSQEFSWRKKEIINLRLMTSNAREHERDVLARAGVAILYAHWEGFVRDAATAYLNFVNLQRHSLGELKRNFVALAMKGQLDKAQGTKKTLLYIEAFNELMNSLNKRAAINWRDAIQTKSNLNSETFKDILCVVGVDYTPFATKQVLIDVKLLKSRNEIAHGRDTRVSFDEYLELHNEVLALMEEFRTQLDNAASLKSYLEAN